MTTDSSSWQAAAARVAAVAGEHYCAGCDAPIVPDNGPLCGHCWNDQHVARSHHPTNLHRASGIQPTSAPPASRPCQSPAVAETTGDGPALHTSGGGLAGTG